MSLLLMYMYMKFSIHFHVSRFRTLLWINEYELQFRSHNDIEQICNKM